MLSLEREREHLAKADRGITDGERRIFAQELLIKQLHRSGHETDGAERLLLTLRQTMEVWRDHRELILQEIARIERAPRSDAGRRGRD